MSFEHPNSLYVPRKREILIYRKGDPKFSRSWGLEYCVLPETSRTESSVQLHIKDMSDIPLYERWVPLGYENKFHRATGRNMEIASDVIVPRARILGLEKEIKEKLESLQDEITPENIGKYFIREDKEAGE